MFIIDIIIWFFASSECNGFKVCEIAEILSYGEE